MSQVEPNGNMRELRDAIVKLEKADAVMVVRVDNHDSVLDELKEGQRYMTRLVISTLIMVVIGVAMATLGVVLAL